MQRKTHEWFQNFNHPCFHGRNPVTIMYYPFNAWLTSIANILLRFLHLCSLVMLTCDFLSLWCLVPQNKFRSVLCSLRTFAIVVILLWAHHPEMRVLTTAHLHLSPPSQCFFFFSLYIFGCRRYFMLVFRSFIDSCSEIVIILIACGRKWTQGLLFSPSQYFFFKCFLFLDNLHDTFSQKQCLRSK